MTRLPTTISKRTQRLLDRSLSIASTLTYPSANSVNMSCFIYQDNRLISIGQNNMVVPNKKASYFAHRFNVPHTKEFPYLHAEISAISRLWGKHYIEGKEKVVIVRFNLRGGLALAKPCANCMPILSALNLSDIYYTTEDGWNVDC